MRAAEELFVDAVHQVRLLLTPAERREVFDRARETRQYTIVLHTTAPRRCPLSLSNLLAAVVLRSLLSQRCTGDPGRQPEDFQSKRGASLTRGVGGILCSS